MPEQVEARRQVWGWRQIKRVLRSGRDKKMGEVVKAFHIALHTGMRLDDMTFHDTRATALTLLARRVDVMTLARISRHKDLSMLLNVCYRESAEQISARL